MNRYLFGVIPIYGLLIASAIAFGVFYCFMQEKRLGLPKDTTLDLCLRMVPCALVGARIYYVIFSWPYYAQNPLHIFYVWEGGLAIYGGVIGGALAGFIFARKRKLSFGKLADMVAPALIFGQAVGRWGNFFNGECFGRLIENPAHQFFPLAVQIGSEWHMATFFYESMWDLCGFFVLHLCRKKVKQNGDLFLGYLVWYGLGRMVIEGLRTDSLMWGPFRVSQVLSALMVLAGGTVLLVHRIKRKNQKQAV